jgi:hypothetical protein
MAAVHVSRLRTTTATVVLTRTTTGVRTSRRQTAIAAIRHLAHIRRRRRILRQGHIPRPAAAIPLRRALTPHLATVPVAVVEAAEVVEGRATAVVEGATVVAEPRMAEAVAAITNQD